MKSKLNIGFLTTCSGRWPRELPVKREAEYGAWLEEEFSQAKVVRAEQVVWDKESLEAAAERFRQAGADVIVMVYGAFTGDDVAAFLAEMVRVPLILWAPYEVPFEKNTRLYANALCAMTMNAAALHRLGAVCHTVYGGLEDKRALDKVRQLILAYHARKAMSHTNLGLLGYRPTAFYNCAFDEALIRRTFGVKIEETDLKVVFDRMAEIPKEACQEEMARVEKTFDVELPEGHLENHARLYLALKEVMKQQGYDFGVIKCWPEMGNLHTTPCAVLGRLADEGVHIGCEGDVDAELAQIAQNYRTGLPTFITDMIHIDEEANTMAFWHCGNAAPSLANPEYELWMRNHPLAGQGSAFWGALKPGAVTIARFCNLGGKYKLFLMKGEALNQDRYTRGIMANVKVECPVRQVIEQMIEEGVPHHYSLVWADVEEEMKQLCQLLGVEVIELYKFA